MISFVLRYLNMLVQLCLVLACGFVIHLYKNKEVVEYDDRKFEIVDSTYSTDYEVVEVTESTEVVLQEDVYSYKNEWEYKYPDIDVPDVVGIDKDAYGNYIITEDMFQNEELLPFNESGYIDYVFYYDYDGNALNPMPKLYNDYLFYFNQNGG